MYLETSLTIKVYFISSAWLCQQRSWYRRIGPSSVVHPCHRLSLNLLHGFLSNFGCCFPWATLQPHGFFFFFFFFEVLEKRYFPILALLAWLCHQSSWNRNSSVRPSYVSQLSLNLMHGFHSNFICGFSRTIRRGNVYFVNFFFLIFFLRFLIFSSAWLCRQRSWYGVFAHRPSVRPSVVRPCRNYLWT